MILYFTVDKKTLKRDDCEIITSYSENIDICHFNCKNKWSDIYKYALFTGVSNKQEIVDLGFGSKVSCKIPSEILKGNFFSVSVFGGDRYTTTQEDILVLPSGFNKDTEKLLESSLNDIEADDFFVDRKLFDYENNYRHNSFEIKEHPYY